MTEASDGISREYILFLLQFDASSELDSQAFFRVLRELENLPVNVDDTRIDVVIHSGGGDAHNAYRIISSVRERCAACRTVVPLLAKSAATLMALGGDEIVMGRDSELGPLDIQMEHPLTEAMRISGLDGVKPLEILTDVASNIAFAVGLRMRHEINLGRKDSIETGLNYAAACIRPVLEKLDPIAIALSYRVLDVAGMYGRELLTRFMFREPVPGEEPPGRIVETLVWDYPSHSYAIRRRRAKELGLRILNAEDYEYWESIHSAFWRLVHLGQDVVCLVRADEVQSGTSFGGEGEKQEQEQGTEGRPGDEGAEAGQGGDEERQGT